MSCGADFFAQTPRNNKKIPKQLNMQSKAARSEPIIFSSGVWARNVNIENAIVVLKIIIDDTTMFLITIGLNFASNTREFFISRMGEINRINKPTLITKSTIKIKTAQG